VKIEGIYFSCNKKSNPKKWEEREGRVYNREKKQEAKKDFILFVFL
jgi:hypothetical protein